MLFGCRACKHLAGPVKLKSYYWQTCKYFSKFVAPCTCIWGHHEVGFSFYIDGLVQERRYSSALAMELRLSCTDPLICPRSHSWPHTLFTLYAEPLLQVTFSRWFLSYSRIVSMQNFIFKLDKSYSFSSDNSKLKLWFVYFHKHKTLHCLNWGSIFLSVNDNFFLYCKQPEINHSVIHSMTEKMPMNNTISMA